MLMEHIQWALSRYSLWGILVVSTILLPLGCSDRGIKNTGLGGPSAVAPPVPVKSSFSIMGDYACLAPIPYNLRIEQEGTRVTYLFRDKEYVIAYRDFQTFWRALASMDIEGLRASYFRMTTTADFRGDLILDITTEHGRTGKNITFTYGPSNDPAIDRIVVPMMNMLRDAHRLPRSTEDLVRSMESTFPAKGAKR